MEEGGVRPPRVIIRLMLVDIWAWSSDFEMLCVHQITDHIGLRFLARRGYSNPHRRSILRFESSLRAMCPSPSRWKP